MKLKQGNRLLFLSTLDCHSWGGSEPLWSNAATILAGRGFQVEACVSSACDSGEVAKLEKAGCVIHRRVERNPYPWWKRAIRRLLGKGRRRVPPSTWETLMSERWDLVVVSSGGSSIPKVFGEPLMDSENRFCAVFQAAAESWWPVDEEREWQERCLRAAAAIFFVSEGNRLLVRRQVLYENPNTEIVRNPFAVPFDKSWNWPAEDVWRFAFVGRLEPAAKGCDILLAVLAQEKWRERNAVFSFYGGGFCKEGVKKLSDLLGSHNVEFLGHSKRVEEIWDSHHALVLPSRLEGLPLVIVESMLCGRPCVVTNVAGNTELLEDNVTGFVADAATEHSLDQVLERVWENRQRLSTMGKAAQEAVRTKVPKDPVAEFADRICKILG